MDLENFDAKVALAKAQMGRPGSGKAFGWLVRQDGDAEPEDWREAAMVLVYAQFEQLVGISDGMGATAQTWHDFLQEALAECIAKQVERESV